MTEIDRGNLVFEERLLPCYLPGGRRTHRRLLLGAYLWRESSLLGLSLLLLSIQTELHDNILGSIVITCDVLASFATVLFFVVSEDAYINGGLSSRPLKVYGNGLEIPPLYSRKFTKEGGFIHKEEIDHLRLKRPRSFNIPFNRKDGLIWHDSPVEFVVYLKKGRKRRSGNRPPETIMEAVGIMKSEWGVNVVDSGFGGGQRVVFKGGKVVERVDL
ncbi:MAG: hypothetical protein ABR986_09505 [Methanomassiliicoccales archaeon]|jgi:hypothetical protein